MQYMVITAAVIIEFMEFLANAPKELTSTKKSISSISQTFIYTVVTYDPEL